MTIVHRGACIRFTGDSASIGGRGESSMHCHCYAHSDKAGNSVKTAYLRWNGAAVDSLSFESIQIERAGDILDARVLRNLAADGLLL